MSRNYLFTSESVSEGHPDKLADRISDAIVDAAYRAAGPEHSSAVRAACETLLKDGLLALAGEMRMPAGAQIDPLAIAEEEIRAVGYGEPGSGMTLAGCQRINKILPQAADISRGVDPSEGKQLGAGDQGIMFGYACREDEQTLMPLPIIMAHELVRRQAQVRRTLPEGACLGPDAKSQVTIAYEDGKPASAASVVLSTQHTAEIDGTEVVAGDARIQELVAELIVRPVLERYMGAGHAMPEMHVNPTGRFVAGGPDADAGLTGRKIIVDTYGGAAPHGGGAFSGKDPTKVDRSAAYAARNVAKSVVASGLADRCLVQLSYAIGIAEPVSIMADTYGTAHGLDDSAIERRIRECFDLTPGGIIARFDLMRPLYRQVAAYGHFGRTDLDLPWEDVADAARLKDGSAQAAAAGG